MMKHSKIAVLMTCYNRRETTLSCLKAIYQQDVDFDVYLVDDGSSDGTTNTVIQKYPKVYIIQGNGNLYWVGGMRLAFSAAMKHGYDYYLWLNDDTILKPDALSRLVELHLWLEQKNLANSIVVGSTQDPVSQEPTYGGAVKSEKWYSNKFEFVKPGQELIECDTMFGNCVLIPQEVVKLVGNIDVAFIHSLGDLDYGLRARKLGCSIWVAPGYIGTCSQNSANGSWVDLNLSFYERLKKVLHVKAFPIAPWTHFTRRHSGALWFLYWFLPYIRAIIGYKNLDSSPTFSK